MHPDLFEKHLHTRDRVGFGLRPLHQCKPLLPTLAGVQGISENLTDRDNGQVLNSIFLKYNFREVLMIPYCRDSQTVLVGPRDHRRVSETKLRVQADFLLPRLSYPHSNPLQQHSQLTRRLLASIQRSGGVVGYHVSLTHLLTRVVVTDDAMREPC